MRQRGALHWGVICSLLLLQGPEVAAQELDTVVLRCGRLIDVRSETGLFAFMSTPATQDNVEILIRGERIQEVGQAVQAPAGARTIDLGEATCLPGLIDSHVHILWFPGGAATRDFMLHSSARKALQGVLAAQTMLRKGFTTLREMGDWDVYYANVEVRDAFDRGDFLGPRLIVAPHFITGTPEAVLNELAPDLVTPDVAIVADGPLELRKAVRTEIKYGADWIKSLASGSIVAARDNPFVQTFTDEEIEAIVEEAHRRGKKVALHIHSAEGIKAAVRAGVDSIEHGYFIDEEAIELMLEHGTYLVPTIYVGTWVKQEEALFPPEYMGNLDKALAIRDRSLRAALASGIKIVFGSDTLFPHELAVREFSMLVEFGLTPLQAIRAATLTAAEMLELDEEIGTIEAGKLADIVAVSGNPLEEIKVLEDVKFVMKSGQVVKNEF